MGRLRWLWAWGVAVGLLVGCVVTAQAQRAFTASSVFDARYLPQYVTDGDMGTRWASVAGAPNPQWWQVDLGEPTLIEGVEVVWEAAYAARYRLEVSDDGTNWRTLAEQNEGRGGLDRLAHPATRARYLRVLCLANGPFPLHSIWELRSSSPELMAALAQARERDAEAQRLEGEAAKARAKELIGELATREIVFAVRAPVYEHWYANFGYYAADRNQKLYHPIGGYLQALNLGTGEVRDVLADPQGALRDPQVSYDGRRIVFSYLKAGTESYHLYEINADGSGLRQLTDGDCDDIEPCYLPDGGIVFCSSRSHRWVNCWLTPVATLYRCDADGGNVRMLSANIEHDNTPWVLPDGRVLYMRWEYVDRSQVDYHHLWSMNPDGTGQMVFYGNQAPGTAMLDAKPVPGTRRVMVIFSPGHGDVEHQGGLTLLDPDLGPDEYSAARPLYAAAGYRDPFPLSEEWSLAAKGAELHLVSSGGEIAPLYTLPAEMVARGLWLHEPRVLTSRPREPIIQPRVDPGQSTGRTLLSDVYQGRNMAGVKRGEIRSLLVLEALPKPINYTGGMDPLSYGGTFTLERVLGTVPVAEDGSAYMELPALRSLFFVALDEQGLAVKRMQSFLTLQPGELTGCVGCHEPRTRTLQQGLRPEAVRREPSQITPIPDVPEVFDFPRDIQPILDRHCLRCHDYEPSAEGDGPRSGGVILSGDRGPMFSHSYVTLTLRKQVVDGRDQPVSNLAPRSIGTSASPLMHKVLEGHHGVQLGANEIDRVRYWIESAAAYPGTYGALGGGAIGGYYANNLTEVDTDWPATKRATAAIDRRCVSCHTGNRVLPRTLTDERDVSFWRPDWNDPRLPLGRHSVFNLTRPKLSLMLLAPLAREAGGYGLCQATDAAGAKRPVFASTDDPDYQAILGMCEAGKARLEVIKRFDMPGFRPPEPYLREMVKYGVLAQMPPAGEAVDCYGLDERYWGRAAPGEIRGHEE